MVSGSVVQGMLGRVCVVCLLSLGALVGVQGADGPVRKVRCPNQLVQYRDGVKALVPSFASYGTRQGCRVPLLDQSGKELGFLLLPVAGTYERLDGYRDVINAGVVVTPDSHVMGVVTGDNRESRKFMERVRKSGFMGKWNGLTVKEAAVLKVDAVSHATYSSEALRSEVQAALREADRQDGKGEAGAERKPVEGQGRKH